MLKRLRTLVLVTLAPVAFLVFEAAPYKWH